MKRSVFQMSGKTGAFRRRALLFLSLFLFSAAFLTLTLRAVPGGESFAEGEGEVYLSDLKPLSASAGWGDPCYDKGLDGNKIKIASKTYSKGICIHAASELTYDISAGEYTVFSADIGIHDGTNNTTKDAATVKFAVKADGKTIYESGVFKISTPAEHIELNIPESASKLTLITTDAGDGINGDHSAWADAKFTKGKVDPTKLKELKATLDKSELPVGSSTQIQLSMTDRGGNTVSPADAQITYTSLDPAGATVDGSGYVTVHAPGSTMLRVTVLYRDSEYSEELTVRGMSTADSGFAASLSSPGGVTALQFSLDAYGGFQYTVKNGGTEMLQTGTVGARTDGCDFTDGLRYVTHSFSEIREEYSNITGKHSTVKNEANLMTAVFEKGGYRFTVECKAYDDGFAYRYKIDRKDGTAGELVIQKETGYFALPESKLFAIPVGSLSNSFNHEAGYSELTPATAEGKYLAFPVLASVGERWMLLSEAELYGDSYVGSMLQGIGGGKLQMQFAPKTESDTTVTTSAPFTSPWRCGITGTLADIVESELVEKVCDRSYRESVDYSYVKPGVTAWMWLSQGYGGQSDYKTIKEYIDLASEMGWSYLLLDEGWQPRASENSGRKYSGYYSWFDDMMKYAEEKNVGILVWVLCNDLDTPEEREILREWSEKGIKGIKADFFDSEDRAHIGYYQAIYEECARQKLIVNIHGANKPTGERQRWANIINREAVNGEEYGGYGAYALNIWAYTRNVVGPMDLTPRLAPTASSESTVGAQIAMNVLFESGIPCMASPVNEYLASPARSFYLDLPAAWDDIRFIDGYPGSYTVLARRSGENWYLSGTSNAKKELTVKYDFLGDGEYMAFVFRDGNGKYDLVTEQLRVSAKDEITVSLRKGSAFTVKLVKITENTRISDLAAVKKEMTAQTGEAFTPELTGEGIGDGRYLLWSSSDENIATVDREGRVTALRPGNAKITASFLGDPSVKTEISLTVKPGEFRKSAVWKQQHPTEAYPAVLSGSDPFALQMPTLAGDIQGSLSNVWYLDAPEGDFEVTVTLKARMTEETQTAGLVVFDGSGSGKSVALARRFYDGAKCLALYSYNSDFAHSTVKDGKPSSAVLLKLVKEGDSFKGYFSYNGKDWQSFGKTVNMKTLASSETLRVGVYGGSGGRGAVRDVYFSNFTLNGEKIPFSVKGDAKTVKEIQAPASLTTTTGLSIGEIPLPKTVKVIYEDESSEELPVLWQGEAYQPDKAGSYSFAGYPVSDDGHMENPERLAARLTVVSREAPVTDQPSGEDVSSDGEPDKGDPEKSDTSLRWILIAAACAVIAAAGGTAVLLVKKKRKKASEDMGQDPEKPQDGKK